MDSVNFKHNDLQFDVYRAKCKHFYKLLITAKAKLPGGGGGGLPYGTDGDARRKF